MPLADTVVITAERSRQSSFDAPAASTIVNLRAGLAQTVGEWTFTQLLPIDNATDRRYAGSVIVNDANRRFFEPALPRGALLALTARYAFR